MDSKGNSNDENIDEDPVELPPDTLAILHDFLQDRNIQESMESQQEHFEENWQLSQFWYNESTKRNLSKICLKLIIKHNLLTPTSQIKIALISCPSLYKSIKAVHPKGIIRLFEFDTRFSVFGEDFVYYDYKDEQIKEKLLNVYGHYFDIILADPPFLSEECIGHVANLINGLKKEKSDIIMCSGETAGVWIKNSLKLNQCKYRPEHERNLANEFCAYASFDLDSIL